MSALEMSLPERWVSVVLVGGPAGRGRLFAVRQVAAEVHITPDPVRPAVLVRVPTSTRGAVRYAPTARVRAEDGVPVWTPDGRWPA